MGNGAGKNKDAVREIQPNDEGLVDGNDDYYERLEEKTRKQVAAASKPMLGGLFGAKKEKEKVEKKNAPKIVGLIDSDDEEGLGDGAGADRDEDERAKQAARELISQSFKITCYVFSS